MGYFKIIEAEPTTNLFENPSFEEATTGWAMSGIGGSITRATDYVWRGQFGLKFSAPGGASGAFFEYAITLPNATTDYAVQARVFVPDDWDGGDIYLAFTNFAGASQTINSQWTNGTDAVGGWYYLETVATVAGDVAGLLQVVMAAPNATVLIDLYFDAFQLERKSVATTYCDGDQIGCDWTTVAHASTSFRYALVSSGGAESDMKDDLGFDVQSVQGVGNTSRRLNVQPLALLDGDLYQSQKRLAQPVTLVGTMEESTLALFHNERAAVGDAFDPGGVLKDQPRYIIYTGADTEKELRAYYEGGLEANLDGWPREIGVPIRMIAYEPGWKARKDTGFVGTGLTSYTARNIIGRLDGVWDNLGPPATAGTVYAIARGPDNLIYIGGDFLNWDNIPSADYIVSYDPSNDTFSALSTGLLDIVRALEFGPDGTLYVGGDFLNAGGDANADYVAQWNGTAFSAVSSGGTGSVRALKYVTGLPTGYNGLWIGGVFTNWNADGDFDYLVLWNGGAYVLTPGLFLINGNVYAIESDGSDLFIGGAFTSIAGANRYRIARFTPTVGAFAMDDGFDSDVNALELASDNTLYMAGAFTQLQGGAASTHLRAAKWDGDVLLALADGLDAEAEGLAIGPDGQVWYIGSFTTAGTLSLTDGMARWNGSTWLPVAMDFSTFIGATTSYAIAIGRENQVIERLYNVYIGGDFSGNALPPANPTVTNPGNIAVRPVISIALAGGTGAVATTIQNNITGKRLDMDYELQDGETLEIDLRISRDPNDPRGPVVKSSFSGTLSGAILPGSDFTEFELEPGDNDMTVFVRETGGVVHHTVAWLLRASFRGLDD